jgi:hypothetical protein
MSRGSKAKEDDDDKSRDCARRVEANTAARCARWLARGPDDGRRRDDLRLGLTDAFPLGCAYGLGLWALQRHVTLPLRKPEDTLFTTGMVSPQWVWWLAHLALGTGIGLGYVLLRGRLAVALPGRVREMPAQPVTRKAA